MDEETKRRAVRVGKDMMRREFEAAVTRLGAGTCSIHAGRPQTNGVIERLQESAKAGFQRPSRIVRSR